MAIETIILSSNGGGGHITAANRCKLALLEGAAEIINITLQNWLSFSTHTNLHATEWAIRALPMFNRVLNLFGIPSNQSFTDFNFGKAGTEKWDEAQKNGDTETLQTLISWQNQANNTFSANIYAKMQEVLRQEQSVKLVISTQPIGLAAMLQAINDFNKALPKHQPKIAFKIVLTDLLTEEACHFLDSIKAIDPVIFSETKLMIEIGPLPLSVGLANYYDKHQKVKAFFPLLYEKSEKYPDGKLRENVEIEFSQGPIHQEFIDIAAKIKQQGYAATKIEYKESLKPSIQLDTAQNDAFEKFVHCCPDAQVDKNKKIQREVIIPINAKILTIMLGSQASSDLTLALIDEEYILYSKTVKDIPLYIIVFCGNNEALFKNICEKAQVYNTLNKFTILPLPVQNAKTISHFYTIADDVVIKPGGMSCMEALAIVGGKIYFVSENKQKKSELLDEFTAWEKGNIQGTVLLHNNTASICRRDNYQKIRENQEEAHVSYQESIKFVQKDLEKYSNDFLKSLLNVTTNDFSEHVSKLIDIGCMLYCFSRLSPIDNISKNETDFKNALNQFIFFNAPQIILYGKSYAAGCMYAKKDLSIRNKLFNVGYRLYLLNENEFVALDKTEKSRCFLIQKQDGTYQFWGYTLPNFKLPTSWEFQKNVFISYEDPIHKEILSKVHAAPDSDFFIVHPFSFAMHYANFFMKKPEFHNNSYLANKEQVKTFTTSKYGVLAFMWPQIAYDRNFSSQQEWEECYAQFISKIPEEKNRSNINQTYVTEISGNLSQLFVTLR